MYFFHTDRVLIWTHILGEYGTDIEYIQGDKNMVAHAYFPLTIINRLHEIPLIKNIFFRNQ